MNIHDIILEEKTELEKKIANEKKELAKLPDGNLQIYKIGDLYSWYVSNPTEKKKRVYLPKSERELAEKLAYKGYLKKQIIDDSENLRAMKYYLNNYSEGKRAEKYINKNSEFKYLLYSRIGKNDNTINEWLHDINTGKPKNPENLRYNTKAGVIVRSKSEQIIVSHLVDHNVPFKYEERLFYNGYNIYPDFMIMNPRTHEIYIWEHLGMMDNDEYRNKNIRKINDYAKLGFNLGEKLIITCETIASGLDEFLVDFYIKHYLL